MSLINDALKKAQNLQPRAAGALSAFPRPNTPVTTDTAAATTAGTAAPASTASALPPRTGKSPHGALIVGVASTVLLAGVGAIGYVVYALFFMGAPEEKAVASVTAPPAAVKPAKAPKPAPAKTSSLAPTDSETSADSTPTPVDPAPAETAKTSPPAKQARPPVASTASPTPAPAPAPTAPVPVAPAPAAPAPATLAATTPAPAPAAVVEEVEERINNPKPHIQAWVDKITVSGIRPGSRPKALMNDRVFVIGDVVNRDLGLQLHKISDRLLVFEDNEGNTYELAF